MPKDQPRRNPNQRSYHLDDETVAMLEAHAARLTLSASAALRMIIREKCGGEQQVPYAPPPAAAVQVVEMVEEGRAAARAATGIALPPDNQETFTVPAHLREKNAPRAPRPVHEDDDF